MTLMATLPAAEVTDVAEKMLSVADPTTARWPPAVAVNEPPATRATLTGAIWPIVVPAASETLPLLISPLASGEYSIEPVAAMLALVPA